MDPNSTYTEIVFLVNSHNNGIMIDEDRLDALYSGLTTWIASGGFKPKGYDKHLMVDALDIILSF